MSMNVVVVMMRRSFSRWTHRRPVKLLYPELQKPNEGRDRLDQLDQIHYKPVDLTHLGVPVPQSDPVSSNNSKNSSNRQRSTESRRRFLRSNSFNSSTPAPHSAKHKLLGKSFNLDHIDKLTHTSGNIKPNNKPASAIKAIENVFYEDGNFVFNKLPQGDLSTSNTLMKLKSKRDHGRCGHILVEGWRLIADGLQAGCALDKLLFSQKDDLENLKPYMPKKGPQIYKMPYKDLKSWSNLDTCPGIMGIFKTPVIKNVLKDRLPIDIICDNIRDPGNLGAILRAALGVGCKQILLTKGCVNIWDPKVLRSGSGAHFRLPLYPDLTWKDIADKIEEDSSIFIADNDYKEKSFSIIEPKSFFHDDRTKSLSDEPETNMSKISNVPLIPYYEANFSIANSVTIIIGGETEGISDQSYRFAHFRNGMRLNIPLLNGIDSLNTGMALAVIAFEAKRQMLNGPTPQILEKIIANT